MNVKHSSATNEHYTPGNIIAAARECMGHIDLDPASCVAANERVKADVWYGNHSSGLDCNWFGRVFLNPPGGALTLKDDDTLAAMNYKRAASERFGTKSHMVAWWRKLEEEYACNRVTQAVFLGFTIELLQSAQKGDWHRNILQLPLCVPSDRVRFLNERGEPGNSPTHGNVIIGLGVDRDKFRQAFGKIGWCT